jgi:hypothetical protein
MNFLKSTKEVMSKHSKDHSQAQNKDYFKENFRQN